MFVPQGTNKQIVCPPGDKHFYIWGDENFYFLLEVDGEEEEGVSEEKHLLAKRASSPQELEFSEAYRALKV